MTVDRLPTLLQVAMVPLRVSIPPGRASKMSRFWGMSGRINWPAKFAIVIASWLSFGAAAIADVKITITYTTVEHEVSPNDADHTANRSDEFILTGDHKIKSSHAYGDGHTIGVVRELGQWQTYTNFTGQRFSSRWTIENGVLVHTTIFPSYTTLMKVKTNGIDSCSATIENKLSKGYKLFEDRRMSNKEDMKMSYMREENVSCSIASVNN